MSRTLKQILVSAATIAALIYFFPNNWLLPLSILGMIAVHELGHLFMAKYLGYKTGGFVLLPIGGIAILKEWPRQRWHDFLIFWAGPAVGLLETTTLCLINFYFQLPSFWWVVAFFWAAINVFNLLPILPLDGGKILWSIASGNDESYLKGVLCFCFAALSALVIVRINILFAILVVVFGMMERRALIEMGDGTGFKIPVTNHQRLLAIFLAALVFLSLIGLGYAALEAVFILSGQAELNRRYGHPKPAYCHYTMPRYYLT